MADNIDFVIVGCLWLGTLAWAIHSDLKQRNEIAELREENERISRVLFQTSTRS